MYLHNDSTHVFEIENRLLPFCLLRQMLKHLLSKQKTFAIKTRALCKEITWIFYKRKCDIVLKLEDTKKRNTSPNWETNMGLDHGRINKLSMLE